MMGREYWLEERGDGSSSFVRGIDGQVGRVEFRGATVKARAYLKNAVDVQSIPVYSTCGTYATLGACQ